MLSDSWGRQVTSLRIQLNTLCNFKCIFCHMEGTPVNGEQMSPEEIERVLRIAHGMGVNKVKFTGGEPLLRRDIVEIISRTRSVISGDISLTTNGTMLKNRALSLKEAGLDRINISLHSIERSEFQFITGTDAIDRVREGIRAAKEAGFDRMKVNFVVLKGVNIDQIPKMIDFCAEEDVTLQLIEYETTKDNENSEEFLKYHIDLEVIEEQIAPEAILLEKNELHSRPVYTIRNNGKLVRIEFVKPMHNSEFCMNCTRLRLTADGKLKTCLMVDNDYLDIGTEIRSSNRTDELKRIYTESVKSRKPYWRDANDSRSEVFCKVPRNNGN